MLVIWCTGTLRHFIRPALREINYCCRYVIPEKEEKIMKITKTKKNYSQKWKEEYLVFVCSFDFLKPVWNGRVTHRHPHCSYPSIYLSAWGWPGPRPPTADTHTHNTLILAPTLLLSIFLSAWGWPGPRPPTADTVQYQTTVVNTLIIVHTAELRIRIRINKADPNLNMSL